MLHKKIETFSVDVMTTLLRDKSLTSYAVSAFEFQFFFDALSCSVSGGQRALKSSKAESRFHFTSQIELNDEYLCKCFSSWKFLWMSLFQFSEMYTSSLIFIFICSRARALILGKSPFVPIWSHLDEE